MSSTGHLFDSYARTYPEVVNASISASGEDREFFIDLRVRHMVDRLKQHVPDFSPTRVLDFGCGDGTTEKYLREYLPHPAIFGVDTSGESIKTARDKAPHNVFFHTLKGSNLPFDTASVDLIYCNGVFHHIPLEARIPALRELRRVLRVGGFAFIFENNPRNPLTVRAMRKNPFDAEATPITPGLLRLACARTGWNVVDHWYYFFFPHALKSLRCLEPMFTRLPLGGQYGVWLTKAWEEPRPALLNTEAQ